MAVSKTLNPRTNQGRTLKLKFTMAALMNAPDVLNTFAPLIPKGHPFQQRVPARLNLKPPFPRLASYIWVTPLDDFAPFPINPGHFISEPSDHRQADAEFV